MEAEACAGAGCAGGAEVVLVRGLRSWEGAEVGVEPCAGAGCAGGAEVVLVR